MGQLKVLGAVAAFLVSGLCQAQVDVSGPIEYGLFSSSYSGLKPGEHLISQRPEEVERTPQIPAKLGSKFGLRFDLSGITESSAPLTFLYLTPGVVTDQGVRHDKFVVTQKLTVGAPKQVMAFEFTEGHEVVPGEWHFIVFQDDRKLAEQRFIVN